MFVRRISRSPAVPFLSRIPVPLQPSLNSHGIISFADRHLLNYFVSCRYKNTGRMGNRLPTISAHYCINSFSCNTYGPSRKCCKQKTYVLANPFKCNTYKKQGGTPSAPLSRRSFRRASPQFPWGLGFPDSYPPLRESSGRCASLRYLFLSPGSSTFHLQSKIPTCRGHCHPRHRQCYHHLQRGTSCYD